MQTIELKQALAVKMYKTLCLFSKVGSRKEGCSTLTYLQVYYQFHIE